MFKNIDCYFYMKTKKNEEKIIDEAPFAEDLFDHNFVIASQIMRLFQIYGRDSVVKEFKYIVGNG